MLKISEVEKSGRAVALKLEGRVVGEWVAELSRVCETILSGRAELKLDLTDVTFVDANGVSALLNFKSRGVILAHCSPFVEEQLKRPVTLAP